MQPLHELVFPLEDDSFADDIQPVQQRQMQVACAVSMPDESVIHLTDKRQPDLLVGI